MATFNNRPTIEGVVSTTAPKATITRALKGAATPGTSADQASYNLAQQTFASGGNTMQAAGAANAPYMPGAGGAILGGVVGQTRPGYTQNPDGTWTSIYSGTTYADPGGTPGGVGGGTPTTTTPGAGNGTNGLETAVNNPGLGEVSREAIEAQINALEAQYGLDLASIAALGGEIGSQARFLLDQIAIDQGRAQEGLVGQLVGRGILRSGITVRDLGRQAQDFAMKRGEVELNKGSRLRQLAERAGAAGASLGRGKADVIAEIDKGNMNAELRQQLLGELESLTPADIQRALEAAYQGAPSSVTGLISQNAAQQLGVSGFGPAYEPTRGQLSPEVLAMLQANPQINVEDPLLSVQKNALMTANRGIG